MHDHTSQFELLTTSLTWHASGPVDDADKLLIHKVSVTKPASSSG
jgi:hypothetical protein